MDVAELADAARQGLHLMVWHRRWVAAALMAVAVAAGLSALAPRPVPTLPVWVAAHDLTGGRPLVAADLALARVPRSLVPAGALLGATRVVGRLLAAPVRRGEPLTDVRLLEPSLLAAMPRAGLVAVPVRVADGGAAAVLASPGDVVDVLAAPDPGAGVPATGGPVATGLTVLAVPAAATSGADGAGLVIVAATRAQARALAEATVGTRLSLVLRHP